jgi:chromosome segregation ATPase
MQDFSSPFPTAHDTIGLSTLRSPALMPSSPSRSVATAQILGPNLKTTEQSDSNPSNIHQINNEGSRESSPYTPYNILDERLAQYTVDINKFPSGQFGLDDQDTDSHPGPEEPKDDDNGSEIAGPGDFTMNIEKYLQDEESLQGKEHANNDLRIQDPQSIFAVHRGASQASEYSEFGPPLDVSTPSHLLPRGSNENGREETHLEGIEESLGQLSTPCREQQGHAPSEDTYAIVLLQIEHLQNELRTKDEQIQSNRRRVLEAASAAEQIRHLKGELQRKTTLLSELNAKSGEESLLRQQVQLLQKQNDEKDKLLQTSSENKTKIGCLQQQVDRLEGELKNRNELATPHEENSKMVTILRQRLTMAQEQLKNKDDDLGEEAAKLRELTSTFKLQLHQKDTEIEDLKVEIDNLNLEVEGMFGDGENRDDQASLLESRNGPLEENNIMFKNELSSLRSQVTAQLDALHFVATDLSIDSGGKSYAEILDQLKELCREKAATRGVMIKKGQEQKEIDELRKELTGLRTESQESASARDSIELELQKSRERLSECRTLIATIENENSCLTSRLEEANQKLDKEKEAFNDMRENYAAERLRKESRTLLDESKAFDCQALQEAHQAELKSYQEAHERTISAIRSSYDDSTEALRNLLEASERRESELNSQLHALRTSTCSDESQVTALKAEVTRLESIISIREETTADVDRRIAMSVEKREKEWERRADLLLKERDKLAKALMLAWGEKEVGHIKEKGDEASKGPRQGYRYKYVIRNGK